MKRAFRLQALFSAFHIFAYLYLLLALFTSTVQENPGLIVTLPHLLTLRNVLKMSDNSCLRPSFICLVCSRLCNGFCGLIQIK